MYSMNDQPSHPLDAIKDLKSDDSNVSYDGRVTPPSLFDVVKEESPDSPNQPQPNPLTNGPATAKTRVFLQEKCYSHRYIRDKDTSSIVERPDRLRAVTLGLSVALTRLAEEELALLPTSARQTTPPGTDSADSLTRALGQLDLSASNPPFPASVYVTHSTAATNLSTHPAVRYVHAGNDDNLVEGNDYVERLRLWAASSEVKTSQGESEIPADLPQGDLYLCPESWNAMSGAIGTVCEAVDTVATTNLNRTENPRAFVAVRPPGHHCGDDSPSGFCFLNNVAIGAVHAHQAYGVDRVVIFDIDLHHGNGTQQIAWTINSTAHRRALQNIQQTGTRDLQVFYGSLHDILSYPCEDGDADLVRDASVSLHGAHGQYIENVHLQTYTSDSEFHSKMYPEYRACLLDKARSFVKSTDARPSNTLVFISCGFDACEHEYDYMSRHNRKVPVSFYERFAQDALQFAEEVAHGKLISVLEGGYSDRALMSGAMAHLAGLSGNPPGNSVATWTSSRGEWWSEGNLARLEKVLKKTKGRKPRASGTEPQDPWLIRAQELFTTLDRSPSAAPRNSAPPPPPMRMTLRERKKPGNTSTEPTPNPSPSRPAPKKPRASIESASAASVAKVDNRGATSEVTNDEGEPRGAPNSSEGPKTITAEPPLTEQHAPPPLMIKIKIPRSVQQEVDAGLKSERP